MAPADVVETFVQLASRMAFRAACAHGVFWPAVGVVVLVAAATGHTDLASPEAGPRVLPWAMGLLGVGALPTLLLVRRSRRVLGSAAAIYGVGVGAALLGGAAVAMAVGTVAVGGPAAVALITAWRPLRDGEVWARRGAVCAAGALTAPLLVIALATAGGQGLAEGLAAMGAGMGFEGPLGPTAPCLTPPCPVFERAWMSSAAAPLALALSASALCAVAALVVTRAWKPEAVPEM